MSYISTHTTNGEVIVWERNADGERVTKKYDAPYFFYVEHPRGKYMSIFKKRLTKIVCDSWEHMREAVQEATDEGRTIYESDISCDLKVLAQNYYEVPAPKLHITFYDIENDYDPAIGYASVEEANEATGDKGPYAPINAVALHHHWRNKSIVYAVPPPDFDWDDFDVSLRKLSDVVLCKNERELLENFLDEIQDSDCLSGWNSKLFDDPYMYMRIKLVLGDGALDRLSFPNCGKRSVRVRQMELFGKLKTTVEWRGRISLDYMDLFRKYEMNQRPSYKLEAIADEILPHLPKLAYEGSLAELYRNDFNHFVRYNIRDTEILKGFEDTLGYVDLANVMYHSATGLASQVFGTIRLADLSIINYCHNVKNVIVPDWVAKVDGSIQGAMVLYPQIGFHKWSGSIDINSLYPKSIESLNISPETLIGQFTTNIQAWKDLSQSPDALLEFTYEDGTVEVRRAYEWREIFTAQKWACSGYGTAFDQNTVGVIPSILGLWYKQRKEYQKKKAQAYASAQEIVAKYPNYKADGIMSDEDRTEYGARMEKCTYYDRLQYVYKIKLNSTYGALTNYRFRFFRLEMGESTTGTGRGVLMHQLRKINEVLGGKYNVDFPSYGNVKECMKEQEMSWEEANEVCLDGTKFQGKFPSEYVLYGDTDSGYFATGASNQKDATKIADYVAEVVNNSFPQFMREAFLCQPKFDEHIKCGREVVTDSGIFVDKKRYVLHLVDLDGNKVDKLKVMGLEMRKTTTPKPIQKFLQEVVARILREENWDEINDHIIDYRDNVVFNMDLMDIGLPKGVNKVEEYAQKKILKTNEHGKKYAIPGHVSATLHFNHCLQKYGDVENDPISSNTKIKVFYLTKPVDGFKSIALPTDMTRIPAWFTENFRIDRTLHAAKLIDNNLGHIFRAIKQEVPTHQTKLFNSLYSF